MSPMNDAISMSDERASARTQASSQRGEKQLDTKIDADESMFETLASQELLPKQLAALKKNGGPLTSEDYA